MDSDDTVLSVLMLLSVLKFFIIVLALLLFVYSTNLAFRGDLEMTRFLHDYYVLKATIYSLATTLFGG